MSQPWPPPPDLDSIKELVRDADTEEFIKLHGAPADEYDGEAEDLHKAIAFFETAEITVPRLLPIIRSIWQRSFDYSDAHLALAEPEFEALAQQIARFFGPEAKPQVRA
jgi:hypothetical protein